MISQNEIEKSYLHKIIQLIIYSSNSLHFNAPIQTIESMAITIYDVMEARWRKYHSIEHVFGVCETSSAIQIIAGLFHDMVYLHVDRRIHPKIQKYVAEFNFSSEGYIVTVTDSEKDPLLRIINLIFGFKEGQKLAPLNGANEYLSAIVAARMLEPIATFWDIIQIIACIEMTFPFRSPQPSGETPTDLLLSRLNFVNSSFKLKITAEKIQFTIKEAVELGNRDVESFSYDDFSKFITGTWQLILEGNPVFKNPMFTISQYRIGLHKVEKFYRSLKYEFIFNECDHPDFDKNAVQQMEKRAEENLKIGREYFLAKLLPAVLMEAVAELTGGDAPLALFIGQLSQKNVDVPVIVEDFLDLTIPTNKGSRALPLIVEALDNMLFDALTLGKKKNLTMSSYMYTRIKYEEKLLLNEYTLNYIEKKIAPLEYLAHFRADIRDSMLNALAEMASTRREEILAIKKAIA